MSLLPGIPTPVADVQSLVVVAQALKQRVELLAPISLQTIQQQLLVLRGNDTLLAARQQVANSTGVADPLGTSSAVYVMQGVNVTATVPEGATRALAVVTGQIGNSLNNGQSYAQLTYGTGLPPANGDPITGTLIGQEVYMVSGTGGATGGAVPFSQNALVTSLVRGTTYWFGVALRAAGGGTAKLNNLQVTICTLIDPVVL